MQVGVKVISLAEMCPYVGARRKGERNSRRIWTVVLEGAMGNRRKDFEVVDRSEAAFMRLQDWLCRIRSVTAATHAECMAAWL